MRVRVVSLKDDNGKLRLDYGLSLNILNECPRSLQLKLSTGEIQTFNKYKSVNKFQIFEDNKRIFCLVDKQIKETYILDRLIDYACNKIDVRIDYLQSLKENYKKQKRQLTAA